eukprot:SAG22_NODE_2345_length_2685_cov_2.129544_3_plen_88_part_00
MSAALALAINFKLVQVGSCMAGLQLARRRDDHDGGQTHVLPLLCAAKMIARGEARHLRRCRSAQVGSSPIAFEQPGALHDQQGSPTA